MEVESNLQGRIKKLCSILAGSSNEAPEASGKEEYSPELAATCDNFVRQIETVKIKLGNSYATVNEGTEDFKLWFRGQQNGTLPLLPPLLREEELSKKRDKSWEMCPADTMGNALNSCLSQGSPADRLAFLHERTTFLEFSEDSMDALRYAFRKYLKKPKSEELNERQQRPALFILSPAMYHYALKEMLGNGTGNLAYAGEKDTADLIRALSVLPPGLAKISSDSPFRFFLSRNEDDRRAEATGKGIGNLFNQRQWDIPKYPIAVHVDGVSLSEKSKASYFVAYNSYICYGLYYDSYINPKIPLDLEAIQRQYLTQFPSRDPFLYKIEFPLQTTTEGFAFAKQLKRRR